MSSFLFTKNTTLKTPAKSSSTVKITQESGGIHTMENVIEFELTSEVRHEVLTSLARKMQELYVFPKIGQIVSETLLQQLANHHADALSSSEEFVASVQALLQELTHDKHVRFVYSKEKLPQFDKARDSAAMTERLRRQAIRQNFGFHKIERLAGNVGYLDFRSFHIPDWAGETLAAAMNLMVHTDALIIDLRKNRGGYAFMSALFTSYFLGPDPIRLSNLYNQAGECVRQVWSHSYVQGERYKDKPVYVLTSNKTFSAAEDFTHNLKHLNRVTVVGETTGGGANANDRYRLHDHFYVSIPSWRVESAITHTNWESIGVAPHIEVPEARALPVAHKEALQHIYDTLQHKEGVPLQFLEEVREALCLLSEEN
jgi:hypothetical protein